MKASPVWHLYVIRTVAGSLYAGIATDVLRRYREHVQGGRKAARFLRANPPAELVLKRRIGSRSLALKVEYRFKRLGKRDKEAILRSGRLRFDRETGRIPSLPNPMARSETASMKPEAKRMRPLPA